MSPNQIYQILTELGDIKSLLSANTQDVKNLHSRFDKSEQRIEELANDRISFKVFCTEQVKINSKLNGRFESHHQWVEQEIEKCSQFAEREINELKKESANNKANTAIIETAKETAKFSMKEKVYVALISVIGGGIATLVANIDKIINLISKI